MIYISVLHKMWNPGGSIIFQHWLAMKYVEQVQVAVEQEKFRSQWRSLSPKYREWKRRNAMSPKTWEATGELMNRLTVKIGLVVGFSGHKPHIGTKMSCLTLARHLEYGTSKAPARPLFRLVLYDMEHNLNYWKELYELEVGA